VRDSIELTQLGLQRSKSGAPHLPDTPRGGLDDLLACVGIWQFGPGELEEILQDIEQSRLMEMGEAHNGSPT
jgi:hypothetical protein